MRVLYILRYYPTVSETFVYREIDALVARGVEVTIAALGARPDGRLQDEPPDAPVQMVPRRPLVGRLSKRTAGMTWLSRHQRPKDVQRLPWLSRLARKFDRVHVHFGGEAAELAHAVHLDTKAPYTVTVHAVDLFRPRPSLEEVLASAETVLAVADHHVRHLEVMGIPSERLRCGPDLGLWRVRPLPGPELRALFVARNVPKKGLATLLEVWPEMPAEARLEVISDHSGPVPEGVTVLGLQPPGTVRARMAGANLVVLPSRVAADGDQDGVPVVLMEALASGRPVIAGDVGGVSELVDDSVGWLVLPDDRDGLLQALQAASDPSERQQRGRAGPRHLKERGFTLADQVGGLLRVWRRSAGPR